MPCHDEALNERSSMPPVSVTMQPRNLPAAEAELELPLGVDDELLLGADVLLPHAAASRPATVSTALAARVFFTGYLLFRGAALPPFRGQSPPPGPHAFQAAAGVFAAHSRAGRSRCRTHRDGLDHLDHRRLVPMCPGGKERPGPAVSPLQNCNRPESGSAMNSAASRQCPANVPPLAALLSFLCREYGVFPR